MQEKRKLQVTLLTGRTIEQGIGKEQGKASHEYFESAAICYIDPNDLKKLGIKEDSHILVSTEYGSVVVKAAKSLRGPHEGIVFIPYGPWANAVVSNETDSIGMPSLKGITVKIDPAPTEPILSLKELLKLQFRK
jgi:formylmethanofuran dehydrogenase subunit D